MTQFASEEPIGCYKLELIITDVHLGRLDICCGPPTCKRRFQDGLWKGASSILLEDSYALYLLARKGCLFFLEGVNWMWQGNSFSCFQFSLTVNGSLFGVYLCVTDCCALNMDGAPERSLEPLRQVGFER
ncbi:hypothetical protein TNCV_1589581 [Trichonephila clavipes]|uniref:Uncharacterized protein n=1 Tax=Trichonephila clavipes TaxID=2585209 RepID=A0A8X6V3J6_TRICX|nr:hypothetical protein TNCV_1589581 [Trichonephila clavipes]